MNKRIKIEVVRKSDLVPSDITDQYVKDIDHLLDEQIDYVEEEINDEINGLIIERDFLKLIIS